MIIPSIKVTGDTSFSYIEKNAYMGWNAHRKPVSEKNLTEMEKT